MLALSVVGVLVGLAVVLFGLTANLILLGEVGYGAARGRRDVLCVTLGTGIGGGLLLDGKLRSGPHGVAGEVGEFRFIGDDDEFITLEQVASASAVGRQFGGSAESAFLLAGRSDDSARACLESVYRALGTMIAQTHLLQKVLRQQKANNNKYLV